MHHWSDVLAGVAVGLIVAVWNVKTTSSLLLIIIEVFLPRDATL